MKKLLLIPALLCALVACVDKNYDFDFEDGFDTSMTLFGDELSVPLGRLDSISIESFLEHEGIKFSNTDEDGYFYAEQMQKCFETSGMELYYNYIKNKNVAADYAPKDVALSIDNKFSGTTIIEQSMHSYGNQKAEITFSSPFDDADIKLSFDLNTITSKGDTIKVGSEKDAVCKKGETSFKFQLEGLGDNLPAKVLVSNIKIGVPAEIYANIMNHIMDIMTMRCRFRTGFCMPAVEHMEYAYDVEANQDIAKYKFKELELNTDVISTVPVTATAKYFTIIDMEGKSYNDVTFSMEPEILPGTREHPVTTRVKAIVRCEDGFPDIKSVRAALDITYNEMGDGIAMNRHQSCRMENSSMKLRGGVTICAK